MDRRNTWLAVSGAAMSIATLAWKDGAVVHPLKSDASEDVNVVELPGAVMLRGPSDS